MHNLEIQGGTRVEYGLPLGLRQRIPGIIPDNRILENETIGHRVGKGGEIHFTVNAAK